MNSKVELLNMGHGARGKEQRETESKAADALGAIAQQGATAFCRRYEALNPERTLSASDQEEIGAIYHAQAVAAWAACGAIPSSRRALWHRGTYAATTSDKQRLRRSGHELPPLANALPFGALRAWHRATRTAGKQARSYLYGSGAERCELVSWDDLRALRAQMNHETPEQAAELGAWETTAQEAAEETAMQGARRDWTPGTNGARLRRHFAHAVQCVRVYWHASGSRKARAGLAGDLALLHSAALVTRGQGMGELLARGLSPDLLSEMGPRGICAASPRLRDRACDLRRRIAAGDALMTEQPERADLILAA